MRWQYHNGDEFIEVENGAGYCHFNELELCSYSNNGNGSYTIPTLHCHLMGGQSFFFGSKTQLLLQDSGGP